jgi:vancomycin resistance protein YoaR
VIAAGVVVAVPVLLYGVGLALSGGDVPRGTTVSGVAIGGLPPEEAVAALERDLPPRLAEPLELQAGEDTAKVVPRRAGVSLDAAATVDDAGRVGRSPGAVLGGLFGGEQSVDAVLVVDDTKMVKAQTRITDELAVKVRNGGIRFEGDGFRTVAPRDGRSVDPEAVSAAVTAGALSTDRSVPVTFSTTPPAIGAEQVEAAVSAIAEPAVSEPVTVRVSDTGGTDETVSVSVSTFTPYLKVRPADDVLALSVDGEGLREAISDDLGGIETPARDATFEIAGGRPVVVPSRTGRTVAPEELAEEFAVAAVDDGARLASVRLTRSEPELTTEKARSLGVVERISSFTQPFPYAPYRFQNIGQAAERINGSLLLPGETFSMNDTVLERTPENGYTEGFVIKDGRLTEDLGGGVSTITTALWDAAFFAGLERVEQRAHSFFISRYKPGLEATVSWGNLDLKFRNNTDNGVFITAERGRTFVNVTMWGTKEVDVKAEFGPRTNVKPFTRAFDPSPTCTPQAGVNGFTIVVTRVISRDGQVVEREPFKTVYRPATNVVCRAAPSPRPSATPEPTSSPRPTSTRSPAPSD